MRNPEFYNAFRTRDGAVGDAAHGEVVSEGVLERMMTLYENGN
jgi:hypothetical protein